jgi:hypothetical protein
MRRWTAIAFLLTAASTARAADDPLGDVGGDDFFADLDQIPPAVTAEMGVRVGYGEVAAFKGQIPPWIGFGLHGGMGWHVGQTRHHRFGPALDLSVEGPFPEFYSVTLQPSAAWDHVDHHLLVGASLGLLLGYNSHLLIVGNDTSFAVGPALSARIGWSQRWSRVMRRMYVAAEPRVRLVGGKPAVDVSVVVGSGRGW